jgi:molybdopterin/thiamine biosynthesis adenylyltransferase
MHSPDAISDRTTRFVEAVIQADADVVRRHLSGRHVIIELGPAESTGFAGQAIVFTLLNLLVRLDVYCPNITAIVPDGDRHVLLRLLKTGTFRDALRDFVSPFSAAARIAWCVGSAPTGDPSDIHVMISPWRSARALSVWANGWIAYLNEDVPGQFEDANIVGAGTAAALAAAEVFKRLIEGLPLKPGVKVLPIDRLCMSAFDYTLTPGPTPLLPVPVDLSGVVIVGLGGIGSALVAAAASLPEIRGAFYLVDDDLLDPTNLNRHLVARPGDSCSKVAICRRALEFCDGVQARPERFDAFVKTCGEQHELVVVGVDDDRTRREIQATQPRVILNAGTSDVASFQVTRHDYLHGACLGCIARDDLRERPVERGLARVLGLDPSVILSYQRSGKPIPRALLEKAGRLSEDELAQYGDRPLREIQQHRCAALTVGDVEGERAMSISFLSALPGFLLLGELVKERSCSGMGRPPLNDKQNHSFLGVLGRPHPDLLRGYRDKRGGCDCLREPYVRAYRRKWGIPAS